MSKKITIAESELPIMKVLWEVKEATSIEIFDKMKESSKKISTLKTYLLRLVKKGAVKVENINSRKFLYSASISEQEYITESRKSFIDLVFNGSKQDLLLNFVKEEKISKEDLQRLIKIIEEE